MRSKIFVHVAAWLAIGLSVTWAASSPGNMKVLTDFTVEGDRVTAVLQACPYTFKQGAEGSSIVMEGFGNIMISGAPMLPMKRFLIALPPGAMAASVEVLTVSAVDLPGVYRIAPFPDPLVLQGCGMNVDAVDRFKDEVTTNHKIYLADRAFPEETAWLAGRGTLRKYAYATVAFCPFTYYPLSGRLVYHSKVKIAINLDYAEPDGPAAHAAGSLMADRTADTKAAGLFANYAEISDLYATEPRQTSPVTESYDFVIITTGDLTAAITASEFPAWKEALGYNLRTVLTTDSEITSQPGVDLAQQIRNFLRSYYTTWGIEYVLIVGDYATVPMRICYPDPDYHVYDPSDPGLVAPGTPTDYYYADLSYPDAASWDSDGDGYPGEYGEDDPDFLAEVAVGRIPVNDSTRITYTLDKLAAFEQDIGSWKTNVLHAGAILFFENQNHSGYPFVDGATCLDSIETGLMGGMTISHMSEQVGLVTSLFPWPAVSQAALTSAWGGGEFAVVNWSGHGWPDGAGRTVWAWDDGDGVPESGNGEMQSYRFIGLSSLNLDDDHPSIVFAVSCDVGFPEPNPYGNLGIDLLTRPGWGPSAGILSSSRPAAVAGDWKATGGGTEQICYDFNRYMLVENEKVGDALYDGKFHAHTYYGWDQVYEYMDLYNYSLYGDPALNIGGVTAGIATKDGAAETIASLKPTLPNPFTSATTVRFALSDKARVRVRVYDVGGREVAVLADEEFAAGAHALEWHGTNTAGEPLAPGLYMLAFEAAGKQAVHKIVLVR
jgi:hypothetical protein